VVANSVARNAKCLASRYRNPLDNTTHNQAAARRWLDQTQVQRVEIHSTARWEHAFAAAVVATAPSTHYTWLTELLGRGIPTFCEKPLTLDFQQAVQAVSWSLSNGSPLGVNLELHYASYLEQFAQLLSGRRCAQIAIDWLDPWTEQRYGELKLGDVYTDIAHDMWPHCWSILRLLLPQQPMRAIETVEYDPLDGVRVVAQHDYCRSEVRLMRRHGLRERCIRFNDQEAVLNFGQEPGTTLIDGVLRVNQWHGQRPLTRALRSFVEAVQGDIALSDWPIAAANCLDAIRTAQEIAGKISQQQHVLLTQLAENGLELGQAAQRNLLIDTFLPKYSQRGLRLHVTTTEQQIETARRICLSEQISIVNDAPDEVA
jgi:predicted dehydrogenase